MSTNPDTTPSSTSETGATDAPMRVVVVGGVAGGMSAATRLRRLDEQAEIVVVERSGHVSYANCGLPYYVGGVIEDEDDLLLQTPEKLFERFRLDVRVGSEVVGIDPAAHSVTVRSTTDGSEYDLPFDKLVLSPGAVPVRPPIPGFDRVKVLRTVEDAERLFGAVSARPSSAVVIGAGFIGLETAENLLPRRHRGHGRRGRRPGAHPARLRDGDPRPGRARRARRHGSRPASPSPRSPTRVSAWPTAVRSPASSSSVRSACVPTPAWPRWPASTSGPAAASPSTRPAAPATPTSTPSATPSRRSTPWAVASR